MDIFDACLVWPLMCIEEPCACYPTTNFSRHCVFKKPSENVPLGFRGCRASNVLMFSTLCVTKLLAIASMQCTKLLPLFIILSATYAANITRVEIIMLALWKIDLDEFKEDE